MNMKPGFYPFWFWNDRLDEAEVRWQIREMHAQGVKGFFIHPRQGLEQPYLADAFFALVEAAVDEARRLGMVANLYDEYPYPSGAAGGALLVGKPEFHATELVQKQYDVDANALDGPLRLELPRGLVLALRAYPLHEGTVDWTQPKDLRSAAGMVLGAQSYIEQGLTGYNQKRFFASDPTPVLETELPPGTWRIYAAIQCEVTQHKYWGHFLDVLNPEAVQEYIRLTHERYASRLGAEFGKTIQAIFTDETHPGWSARIPNAFYEQCHYSLLDCIEALVDSSRPQAETVRADFYALVSRLFFEAFEQPVAQWCEDHGILYSGEKPYRRFSQMAFMDIPGCEPGHTKAGSPRRLTDDLLGWNARGNARAAASAAYFYGKPGALDECYHSLGWSGTLQDAKLLAEAMTLLGIRYLVPHGFFYSTHALRKHDAPPTFFYQMPYWRHFGKLSARIDKIWEELEGTHIDADVLIVDPTVGQPEHEDKQAYVDMQAALMARGVEFLHVDVDLLEQAQVEDGVVRLSEVWAKAVIVPPMPIGERQLDQALQKLRDAGAVVIEVGRDFEAGDFLEKITPLLPKLSLAMRKPPELWMTRRMKDSQCAFFFLNTSNKTLEWSVDINWMGFREIRLDKQPRMLYYRGEPPGSLDFGKGGYARKVGPYESFLIVFDPSDPSHAYDKPDFPVVTMPMDGEMQVTPHQPNLLRLGEWQMALLDENGDPGPSATVPAVPLANQLAASRLPFAPGWAKTFGLQPRMELPTLRVRYHAAFYNNYSGEVELVMEPGSIMGDWNIRINDAGPFTAADFHPTDAHIRGSLGLPITVYLHPDENIITVEVTTDRTDGGLLNPLYLAGDFAVTFQPINLAMRKETGKFEDWEGSGLPFYAGVVDYALTFDVPRVPEGDTILLELQTDQPFLDAAEVSINGSEFLPILWHPRRAAVPVSMIRTGSNEAVVRVSTTLIRAFEGTWFDEESHGYRKVGEKTEL